MLRSRRHIRAMEMARSQSPNSKFISGQPLRLRTNKGTVLASLTPGPSRAERKRLQVRAGSHNSTGLPSGSCILEKRPTSESYSARVSTSTPSFVSFAMRASRSSIAVQHGRNNRCLWRKAQKSSFRRPAAIPIMQIVDAEMFLIPFSQARDICCSEEYATNSNGSEFLPLCEKGRDVAPPRRQYQAGPLITPVSNRER